MVRHGLTKRLVSAIVAAAMMTPAPGLALAAVRGTWLAPQPEQVIDARNVEVSVGYNTQSEVKVTRLELWVDGRRTATRSLARPESRGVCSFWWDTSKFAPGSHDLSVKIYADNRLLTTISRSVVIEQTRYDLFAPSVLFPEIKSGDVLRGTANIKMSVVDDGGEEPIVGLLVDNVLKFLTNRKPYVFALDTTKYNDGVHELRIVAYDSAGNKSSSSAVKVVFRNGIERPMIAALDVETGSKEVAPSEDDGIGKLLPPLTEPDIGSYATARASEPEVRASKSEAARPVAPKMRMPNPKDVTKQSNPSKKSPVVLEPSGKTIGAVPQTKSMVIAAEPRPFGGATEPIRMGPPSTLTEIDPAEKTAPVPNVVGTVPETRNLQIALNPLQRQAELPKSQVGEAVASKPKLVQVAMLPTIREGDHRLATRNGIICSPPIRDDRKAILDKRFLQGNGKIKLRDLVNELGGIVFWDSQTRTATAYFQNLKIEVQVGNPIVKVNGKNMRTSLPPQVVGGRVIIDVALYTQACSFA
ncbi:MAG: stalk domain-containing protein [Armatimonadetes bacterium]|nr:stalk domain-containing protein [Armatimonadota bacterium]